MDQPQYNMFHREKAESEFKSLYNDIGLGTTIWSPLASGLLTGKYNDGIPDDSRLSLDQHEWLKESLLDSEKGKERLKKVGELAKVTDDIGIRMPHLALAWCLKNQDVSTVNTSASKPGQVKENMKAIDKVDLLTDDVIDKIEEILDNKPDQPQDFRPDS